MTLTPYEYQQRDIDKLVANDGTGIIATQVGGGKTLIAIETAKVLNTKSNLVIAPKGTHKRAWERTIRMQIPDADIHWLDSSYMGRQSLNKLANNVPGWYLISPELFRRFSWRGIVPDLAIFDEAHRASNRKSKTAIMLHTLKAKRRLAMSGTIAGNKIDGMWSVLKWVFPDVAGRSYWQWVEEYCSTETDYFAGKVITGERNPGAIVNSIPCYIRHLKRENCCEFHPEGIDHQLPKTQTIVRTVKLTAEQKAIYKQMEKDFVVWLGEHPLVVEVPVSLRIRLRQITLGTPTISAEGEVGFSTYTKSSKIDELFDIIDDSPVTEKMLILTHSQKFAKVVTQRLAMAGHNAQEWSGAVSQTSRNQILEDFIDGDIRFIVAVISAIGEGTDGLQLACSTVVWLSKDDNALLNEQASGRLDRQGQKQSVVSYEIIAEGTYDEGQLSNLVSKKLAMNASLRKEVNVE
jgi:superfamily II DNA or RNA helicase